MMTNNSIRSRNELTQEELTLDSASSEHLHLLIKHSIDHLSLSNQLNHSYHHSQLNKPNRYWSNELNHILHQDLLPCFDQKTINGLQITKHYLIKALKQSKPIITSTTTSLKNRQLKRTGSSIFNNQNNHTTKHLSLSSPSLPKERDLYQCKSPDQSSNQPLSLSPLLLSAAFQTTGSPPDFLALPEPTKVTSKQPEPSSLKSKTIQLIIDSYSNQDQIEPQINLYIVKFHLRRIKTKPLENQREVKFEPNVWQPITSSSTSTTLQEPSLNKPISNSNRIIGQTDIVELFSDCSKISDYIGEGDEEDEEIIKLKDGKKLEVKVKTIVVGGTITLKGPGRELRKLKKVIELAIFAACNLKLEAHVLRDSSCSRPKKLDPSLTPTTNRSSYLSNQEDSPTARIAFAQETPPHSSITSRRTNSPSTTPLKTTGTTSLPYSIPSQFSNITADSNWLSPPPPAISSSFSLPFSAPILNKPTEDPSSPSDQDTINNPSPSSGRVKWSKAGLWGLLLGKPSNTLPIYDSRPSSSYERPRDRSSNSISGGSDADDDEDYTPNSPTPRKKRSLLQNNELQSIKLIENTKQDQDSFPYKPQSNSSVKPRSSSSIKSKLSPLKSNFNQTKQLSKRLKQRFEDRQKQQQKIGIMPGSFFYNTYGRYGGLGRARSYDEEHDDWELVAGDDGGETTDAGETTECGEEEEEGAGGDESCSIDSSLPDDRNRAKTISPTSPQPIRSSFVHKLSNTFMHLKAVRSASSRPQLQRPLSEPSAVTATKNVESSPPRAEQSQSETEREESEGEESVKKPILGRFERVIEKMNRAILSVSPDVVFPPPHLLVRLRQQEIAEMTEGPRMITELPIRSTPPSRPKLNPLDRQRSFATADAEVLSARFANNGSTDSTPVRYPNVASKVFTHSPPVFYGSSSSYTTSTLPNRPRKITVDARTGLASLMTNNSSLDGTLRHQSIQFLCEKSSLYSNPGIGACERPVWKTWRYYDHLNNLIDNGIEHILKGSIGQVIDKLIDGRDEKCNGPETVCGGKRNGDHVISLIHHTIRIIISVEDQLIGTTNIDQKDEEQRIKKGFTDDWELQVDEQEIMMWTKCRFCGKCTKPMICSQATLLFSFSKYLELILYDPNFVPTTDVLCEHGTDRQDALIRFFSKGKARVKLALETVDLFELRLPTAIDQSIRDDGTDAGRQKMNGHLNESIQQLEEEIDDFFRSLEARTSLLDEILLKHDQSGEVTESSPKQLSESEKIEKNLATGVISRGRSKTIKVALTNHRALLAKLVGIFQREEATLRAQLPNLNPSTLNSLRKPFVDTIERSKARLVAWEKNHQVGLGPSKLGPPNFVEPFYAIAGNHALPAESSVVVREAELSTIIAFTLSSVDYKRVLTSSKENGSRPVNHLRVPSNISATTPKRDCSLPVELLYASESLMLGSGELPDAPSNKASPLTSPQMKTNPTTTVNTPTIKKNTATTTTAKNHDPDDEHWTFGKDCSFEGHARLKRPSKQAHSILSLRALSKQKSFDMGAFRAFTGGGSRVTTPAKMLTQDPMNDAVLANSAVEAEGGDDRILDDLIKSSENSTVSSSTTVKPTSVAPGPVAALLSRGARAEASTVSISHAETLGDLDGGRGGSVSGRPISLRSKPSVEDFSQSESTSQDEDSVEIINDELETFSDTQKTKPASEILNMVGSQTIRNAPSSSILTGPLNAIWALGGSMKLKPEQSPLLNAFNRPQSPEPGPSTTTPHIKYKFRHGTREFSCTVWHADAFRSIRERCGVSEGFVIESLSRCNAWSASGGKSKSNFFLTVDQRFILKGMITTWNMSEREALLNFAPTYFEYISSSTSMRPSVMCKILGFFTVKIKESGKNENMVKLDLLLMENLFHGQTITRKFDLKGITTRVAKVKPSSENGTTGWDADWIEGSLRTLLLIHPHSKHVIASAIENDTKFLAENNVMDYSLLVGVDDVRKELVVGMIDVIGTFNLAKMLESRGKMVLKSSDKKGEVTILPPIEYATRFRKAMETYFVAVPEKWSRPSETQTREREWQEDPSLASVF